MCSSINGIANCSCVYGTYPNCISNYYYNYYLTNNNFFFFLVAYQLIFLFHISVSNTTCNCSEFENCENGQCICETGYQRNGTACAGILQIIFK